MTQTTPESPVRRQRAQVTVRTLRTDRWWLQPLLTFLGLASFLVYSFWAIFNNDYFVDPYIAPFSSPCLAESCPEGARFLGLAPFGEWYALPPALLILAFPAGFRFTCYYYRKSYYRSFWLSPAACAVQEPHGKYTGETRFPLILQNLHRYFFYAAIAVGAILTYDAILALIHKPAGLGTYILLANAVLIWCYTLGCHSCRSITGGRLNHFSRHPVRYKMWQLVSKLNAKHQPFAWASMFSVMIADFYVRLVAMGVISFSFA
ncbi:MAG: hypothetical protein HOV86_14105 [Thermoactinospora sp.]|nr:hypothetical protein [Thermoactinospora sp.]